MKSSPFPFVAAMAMLMGLLSVSLAQQTRPQHQHQHLEHNHTAASTPRLGPHKGTLRTVAGLQTETIVSPRGLKVYLYASSGQPISAGRGRGVASLSVQGNAKRYRYDLFPAEDGSLKVDADLSKIAGRQITVDYELVGITNQTVAYKDVAVVPADQAQQDAIARQKVCPVSGKPLGSMGQPIKLLVSGKPLYLCCKGCIKKVQALPEKYLAVVYGNPTTVSKGTQQVRPGVFKVAAADQPFIAAQKKCPVMDEPLNAMGGPYKVNANGKAIYICCPGCAKKIAAEPQKWLAVLASQGVNAPTLR